jgi:hypothetical protein
VASGGGDDDGDDDGGDAQSSSNRTAVAQSRTRVPLTSTAIARARETAIAAGTPEQVFDAANPTPTSVPTGPAGGGSEGTPPPGSTAGATEPALTATEPPTSTPVPPGVIGVVTMDANPSTAEVDHTEVTAAVGATFQIGITIHEAPGPYQGYQYGLRWDDNGILDFVSEDQLMPVNMTLCTAAVELAGTIEEGSAGVYGGCLSPDQSAGLTYQGPVANVTLRCAAAGRIHIRPLSADEDENWGSSLINTGGVLAGNQVDNGFDVVCG